MKAFQLIIFYYIFVFCVSSSSCFIYYILVLGIICSLPSFDISDHWSWLFLLPIYWCYLFSYYIIWFNICIGRLFYKYIPILYTPFSPTQHTLLSIGMIHDKKITETTTQSGCEGVPLSIISLKCKETKPAWHGHASVKRKSASSSSIIVLFCTNRSTK